MHFGRFLKKFRSENFYAILWPFEGKKILKKSLFSKKYFLDAIFGQKWKKKIFFLKFHQICKKTFSYIGSFEKYIRVYHYRYPLLP